MLTKKLGVIACLVGTLNMAYANNDPNFWHDFSTATTYIKENKFNEAIPRLERLEKIEKNFHVALALGDAYSGAGDNLKALNAYSSALTQANEAKNKVIERVALFKIARTQLRLKQYQAAYDSYNSLLAQHLDHEDKVIAQAGLAEASKKLPTPTAQIALRHGDEAASQEKPKTALVFYKQAYDDAVKLKNEVLMRVALFKMARMHVWLVNYDAAVDLYSHLLSMRLDPADKKVALLELNTVTQLKKDSILQKAHDLIVKNQGKEAYNLIKPYLKEPSFSTYLVAAQSKAIMGDYQQSYLYFAQCYRLSSNHTDKKISLFGMIRMQIALKNTVLATHYLHRLHQLPRSASDRIMEAKLQDQIHDLTIARVIAQSKTLLDSNKGRQAYEFVSGYLNKENNPTLYIIAAEAMAMQNQPLLALELYKKSYSLAKNNRDSTAALFGIAKMQFWLSRYVAAKKTYNLILQRKLTAKDHELALAGLVKSLAYYDRPRTAAYKVPSGTVFHTPQLTIAAAQAYSWSDWPDRTRDILLNNATLLKDINPNSGLGMDLRDLQWQTRVATAPHLITPMAFASADSETFRKRQAQLTYRRYWNYHAQTFLGPDYIRYSQYQSYKLEATGFYFRQIVQPTRYLAVQGMLEPIEYKNLSHSQRNKWNPLLWNASANLVPNDYFNLSISANHEVIETFPAFANEIMDNQYAATLNISPLPYVKVNGSGYRLNINDGNIRDGYFTSASLLASPSYGISIMGIIRGYTNKFRSPNYFSPHLYNEKKVLLKLGRRFHGVWHYYLDGGLGRQYITAAPDAETSSSPTYQWGLGCNGPITKALSVTLYYADIHQASSFINSPDYSYQYGALSFNLVLS